MENPTLQETKNVVRINQQLRAAQLLSDFVTLGFKSYSSLKTICNVYDQSITADEVKSFWYVSNNVTADLCNKVETVIHNLKNTEL